MATNIEFVVQYEVEFDDGPSENDTVIVTASDEFAAMERFDDTPSLQEAVLKHYPNAMCVTANAAWPVDEDAWLYLLGHLARQAGRA